jgi:hypothetical protein
MLNIFKTAWTSENRNEYTITSVSIELQVPQSGDKSSARKPYKNVKTLTHLLL